jgi:osmotically-inducible protein OsmY
MLPLSDGLRARRFPIVNIRQSAALTGSGNTVTLIGHVRTEAQRDAVVRAVWRGHAVMAVIDQIEITV